MPKPFFHELVNVRTKSELYSRWVDYLLALTDDDIKEVMESGITHQADALRSMVREVIAGQPVHRSLLEKIDNLYKLTHAQSNVLQ